MLWVCVCLGLFAGKVCVYVVLYIINELVCHM